MTSCNSKRTQNVKNITKGIVGSVPSEKDSSKVKSNPTKHRHSAPLKPQSYFRRNNSKGKGEAPQQKKEATSTNFQTMKQLMDKSGLNESEMCAYVLQLKEMVEIQEKTIAMLQQREERQQKYSALKTENQILQNKLKELQQIIDVAAEDEHQDKTISAIVEEIKHVLQDEPNCGNCNENKLISDSPLLDDGQSNNYSNSSPFGDMDRFELEIIFMTPLLNFPAN
ncbi:hypothetical protein RFI_28731 [Reticulomyxa filosa]|uniref:Uncharacterized protein n=1 Tax=Reticulomyxa filosa TaxID=46433 RepID=X6M3V2_RETFI|nr:hypothetical protein RFI_28731 [Reticulomyxa filosa]|eukprot:ETO08658.1 hypothetical protein RFI_28731 [Reticulomyxa filosa]